MLKKKKMQNLSHLIQGSEEEKRKGMSGQAVQPLHPYGERKETSPTATATCVKQGALGTTFTYPGEEKRKKRREGGVYVRRPERK